MTAITGGADPGQLRSQELSPEDRQRTAHLEDSDERAVANIGGGAPNRWGKGDKYHQEARGTPRVVHGKAVAVVTLVVGSWWLQ
eukprot:Skav211527  [mRNA]  locus=scaffold352:291520:292173:- [translate_table: standard]